MSNRGIYEKFFKRLIDILFSILGLIMLWPLMTFVAILVRIKLGSPVIFKQ
ncbi:TPA: sugar transferase, partial [Enterococcus faecium]